jgi:hypothetical protein
MAYFVVNEPALAELASTSSPFKDLLEYLDTTLGNWSRQPNGFWRSPKFSPEKLPLASALAALEWAALKDHYAELFDYPTFGEFTATKYDNQVPSYVPGSRIKEYDEETGEQTGEIKVTWDNWKGPNQFHYEFNNLHHVPLVHNGRHLLGSVLVDLVDGGIVVKPMSEWPQVEGGE